MRGYSYICLLPPSPAPHLNTVRTTSKFQRSHSDSDSNSSVGSWFVVSLCEKALLGGITVMGDDDGSCHPPPSCFFPKKEPPRGPKTRKESKARIRMGTGEEIT